MLIIFSPALAFFAGRTLVKMKQLEVQNGGGAASVKRLEARLDELEGENRELKQRVETLETIATGGDPRSAGIDGAVKLKELEEQVRSEVAKKR